MCFEENPLQEIGSPFEKCFGINVLQFYVPNRVIRTLCFILAGSSRCRTEKEDVRNVRIQRYHGRNASSEVRVITEGKIHCICFEKPALLQTPRPQISVKSTFRIELE
jgi:hypothetical protein